MKIILPHFLELITKILGQVEFSFEWKHFRDIFQVTTIKTHHSCSDC